MQLGSAPVVISRNPTAKQDFFATSQRLMSACKCRCDGADASQHCLVHAMNAYGCQQYSMGVMPAQWLMLISITAHI